MRVCRYYTFELEFLERAKLPRWKGNLIRGSLGYHLRRLYCVDDTRECQSCQMIFRCPFGYLFRTKSKGIVLRKIEGYAKPYVVKPPIDENTTYDSGHTISFSLVLFGDSVMFEYDVFRAVKEMCKFGLGIENGRGRLRLRRVLIENPFRGKREVLYEDDTFYDSKMSIRDSHLDMDIGKIFRLNFLTPFRLIKNGAIISEPSFRDLTRFMLRRYSAIRYQYIRDEVDFDIEGLLKRSEKVSIVSSNLQRRTFVYKNGKEEFLHGEITYHGRLNANLRKLLSFCTLSHVGKRASYGHGWFLVS
jgi:hypothetical protein